MRSTIVRFFLFVLFVCSSAFSGISQAVSITDIHFKELTLQDGLSDLTILDIAEDKDGYIWIATLSGLNRYSGYDIKQYTPSHDSEHSLPSDIINGLATDAAGNLWIATSEGLVRYRYETDDFEVSPNIDMKVLAVTRDTQGNILAASPKNIIRIDVSTSKIIEKLRLPDEILETSTINEEGEKLYIGSKNQGLYIINTLNQSIKKILPDHSIKKIDFINSEPWVSTDKGSYVITKDVIDIFKDYEIKPRTFFSTHFIDTVLVGTSQGLALIDAKNKAVISFDADKSNLSGIKEDFLLSSLLDSTGKLWIGSYQGLFLFNSSDKHFNLYKNQEEFSENKNGTTIWGIDEDKNGDIWIATQSNGLGLFDKSKNKTDYFLQDEEFTIWDLAIDKNQNFWLATSSGVKAYSQVSSGLKFETSILDNFFIDSFLKNDDKIWIVNNQKSEICEIRILALKRNFSKESLVHCHHQPELSKGYYKPVYLSENKLWISSKERVLIYNTLENKFSLEYSVNDKLPLSNISKVYKWRGSIWVVSLDNKITHINGSTFQIKEQKEIAGNITSSLAAEGFENTLWIATTKEIYAFDLIDFEVKKTLPGILLENNNFNEGASLHTKNHSLIFGGNLGFNVITRDYVESLKDDTKKTATPVINSMKIFGNNDKDQVFPKEKILRKGASITLNHFESRFSFSFLLVNPSTPDLTEYRYKLVGYDSNWLLSDINRVAQFNNISFGNYEFEVQARESGKLWSDPAILKITIERPPWLQTPALVLYAVIASCIMLFILRQYQVRKQNQLAIKESEERLKLTLWSSGDELWDWDVYRGQVFRSNTWGTLDFPQDNIRTTSAYDANIHPNDLLRVQQSLKAHLEGQSEFYEQAYRAKTFSNRWIWVLDRGKVVSRDHNGQPVRMTGTLKDIHHLKEAEEQLNLFKRSIENISEGVFITNTNFKFISVNNAYCRYTGETREQALASYLFFHQYPEPFTEEIKKTLKVKGNWFGEVESVRVNGDKFEIELNIDAVHDDDGKISHFVGVFSDITSRKSTEKELLKLANTDPLTDLPNRSFFQASHANLVRRGESHALLCLDMDNFKKINDSLGHQTGDVLIKQIAKRIQRMTGKTATCYRLGGDEFSVLLEDKSDIHLITHFAQGLLDILARPFIINKQEFVLGASIGIAFYPDDGTTPQEMLKNADTAMYFAKNNGGNSYKFFSGEMNQNAVRQLQIENLIRQGIKDDLFSVYYQPKVDINSGRLVSMEALVRFEHPSKGIVSPGQFIPLAEQTGQIIEIGEQVLRKALIDTKRWVSQGIFSGRVAVNLSAKQFELSDLDDRITKILTEVGLSPLHLECELTEGTLMENPEEGLRMMERLREKGIHLALDDFGTGYSSLAYLKRFPLNTLKIDKAFIDDIAKSNVDRHMAAAIIQIAHNLGLKVVAEGVEEEEQLAILRRYDCEMLQGYLYSRPLSADRFEQLLLENQKLHQLINKHSSH
ncbi:EAL domain-containing protein [Salinimonas lutimaris]|uniref:EAL domain-containing protein n=1 Tax=Salinimonas lutimaris TaxID=914153 RepID=UPI0010C0D0E4|nr:EAL domain-containing protein [Salinimonas lutimaris]